VGPAAGYFPPRNTPPHPPGDPNGGVAYLRIVLSPEEAPRMCIPVFDMK